MSSTDDTVELKAGHAPAVKVGGMRVVQKHPPHLEKTPSKEEKPKERSAEDEAGETNNNDDQKIDESESTEVERREKKDKIMVSGAPARGNADFPAEAVKAFHEKPMPSKSPINHVPVNNIQHRVVHQPRGMNH